jgi:hypothetical protein
MTNNFSNYHRYSLFFKDIIPFLSIMAFAQVLLTKKMVWKFIFLVSFVLVSFIMIMDIQKAPLVWYIFRLTKAVI